MKTIVATLTAALTATAAFALAVPAAAQSDREIERSERAFSDLVEGWEVAGEPESCITTFNSNRLRVVEHVGFAYRQGDTMWVARARNPQNLGAWDVPIIDRFGSQLCRHDSMRTVDRSSGMFSGNLFLDDFVPYRRVDAG
ncbi:hypothetical protein GRI62_00425 [Erythrobacter arachoides]|uniref:Uncharacterized protein n=1 Tax=Aurantiacibacter arachoides TaxID=1850444 RepID=A0A844ZXZ1_9SPHN|nr:hypothetical protein [Aurantiacibacter arachoides]MXO92070.1 hypothetical protein [Aurantiacibacter arachoides]GGD60005.1 hypothetical protein GCM10011411_20200 [Aurantiacibacter arachoides]